MSTNQKFVKNTNTPPQDSILWSLGEGWKRSEKGNDYTTLIQISDTDLGVELCKQIEATRKEPIEYKKQYFVPSVSQNGKFLVYAFSDLKSAENKAKWEKPVSVPADLDFRDEFTRGEEQNQINEQLPIQASNTAASSTVQYSKPQTVQKTIDVISDPTIIKVGDIAAIGEAEQRGLYCLPVIHTGNNRICFQSKEENDNNFYMLYGRIISVKVGDN